MDFSLAEYVPEAFVTVVAALEEEPIVVLARATDTATARRPYDVATLTSGDAALAVEHGPLAVGPARAARLPVAWRSPAGVLVIDAGIRVLPVDDGADPLSELLLCGTFSTLAARRLHPVPWLRHVIETLATEIGSRDGRRGDLARSA